MLKYVGFFVFSLFYSSFVFATGSVAGVVTSDFVPAASEETQPIVKYSSFFEDLEPTTEKISSSSSWHVYCAQKIIKAKKKTQEINLHKNPNFATFRIRACHQLELNNI